MKSIFKNYFSDEDYPLVLNCIDTLKSDWELGMQLLKGSGYYKPLIKFLREYYSGYFNPSTPRNILLEYSISSDNIPTNGHHTTSSKDNEGFNIWLPLFPSKYHLRIACERTRIMNSQDVQYPIHLHTRESYGMVNDLPQTITDLTYQIGTDKYCKVLQSLVAQQPLEALEITNDLYDSDAFPAYIVLDSFFQYRKTIDLSNCTNLKKLKLEIFLTKNSKLPESLEGMTIDSPFIMFGMDKQCVINLLAKCPQLEYWGTPVDEEAHNYLLEQGFKATEEGYYR